MNAFNKPNILRIARRIVKKQVCDHCLGRQFAQVSTGMTNQQRGKMLRKLLKRDEPEACSMCGNLFRKLGMFADQAAKNVKGVEFSSFLVGTKLSSQLIQKEEEFWVDIGIEHCEPLKSELNRELGKILQKKLKKEVDEKKPDVIILLNLQKNRIDIDIRPLYIYGKYKKLVRGIPQTKWEKYSVTVEDIIAKPLMKAASAKAHAMHGCGREDIDARCLDWRPFVFELQSPCLRKIPLKKMEKAINMGKKVNVNGLRFSDKKEVIRVKELRPDKSYRVLVLFEEKVDKKALASLKGLVGIINQKTPSRVLHRRADLMRKRKVKSIQAKLLTSKKASIDIRGEAGLYIKELVTGDGGRTSPSVSKILGPTKVKELDVIKIHIRS